MIIILATRAPRTSYRPSSDVFPVHQTTVGTAYNVFISSLSGEIRLIFDDKSIKTNFKAL